MRKKQLFAVLMAGSMAASLTACSSNKTDTKKTTEATKTEAATEKKTEAATEATTEKATEKETEAATEAKTEKETEVATEEASTEAKSEEASSEEESSEADTEEASSEEASSEEESSEADTEEASSEEASSEEKSSEADTEEASSEEASSEEASSEAATEEASSEEASSEEESIEAATEEAASEEASSEEASSEADTEEASSEEASSEEESSEEASSEADTEEASSEEASSEEESEKASEEESESETEEDIDGTGFKIGMVTDVGGVNDGSFNQSAWEGLQRAGEDFGCEVKYIESKGDADYVPNIESFLDEDYDLIICIGYMMADAVRDAAELYPDQKFAIVDDSSNADLDNVTCMMFEQEQASYLVGLAAGYTTESNVVGFITGASNETMNSFGYGYLAGVLDANPDATILQYNANSFGDASGGKSAVNNMVTNDADVIFHAAGGTGIGVIDGCKENGIWAIGVDSDQSPLAPETILTSALKRVDNACYDATKETILGTIEGGVKTYDLEAGGVDIAPTTDNLSKDVIEKIEKAKEEIIAGDLVVPKNKEEFEEQYGDVYELD